MERKSRINIANGVICSTILACGITISAVMSVRMKMIADVMTRNTYRDKSAVISSIFDWAVGFICIIPGITGILASIICNKCLFSSEMVMCIIALITSGASFGIWGVKSGFSFESCYSDRGQCVCSTSRLAAVLDYGFSCEDVITMIRIGRAADGLLMAGAIFTIVATILAAKQSCTRQPGQVLYQMQDLHQHQYMVGVPSQGLVINTTAGYVVQPGYVTQPLLTGQYGYPEKPPAYKPSTEKAVQL